MWQSVQLFALALCLPQMATAVDNSVHSDANEPPQAAAHEINAANELVRKGQAAEALIRYQSIAETNAVRDELHYNQAVALYRQNEFAAAAQLFAKSSGAQQPLIATSSKYNLGNCRYQLGLAQANQNPKVAIGELQQAIAHFRGALRSDPQNNDARINIELANKLIEQLRNNSSPESPEQNKQNQQNESTERNEDKTENSEPAEQDPQKESGEEKEGNQNDGSGNDDQKNDDRNNDDSQSSPDSGQEQSDEQTGEQSKAANENADENNPEDNSKAENPGKEQQHTTPSDGTQTQPKDSTQPPSPAPSPATGDDRSESVDNPDGKQPLTQNSAQDNDAQDEKTLGSSSEDQETTPTTPAGDLTSAESNNQSTLPDALADEESENKLMSREEALKLLQAVRDRDMLRRLQRQQRDRNRRVPVDRDW